MIKQDGIWVETEAEVKHREASVDEAMRDGYQIADVTVQLWDRMNLEMHNIPIVIATLIQEVRRLRSVTMKQKEQIDALKRRLGDQDR